MGFFSNLFKSSTFFESEYTDKSVMPVAQVLGAHANWKSRLNRYMEGTLGYSLDPDVLAEANDTELGRWILQVDTQDMSDEKKSMLKQLHETNVELHKYASEIARKVQEGKREEIAGINEQFQETAKRVLMLLLDISKKSE